MFQLPNFNRGGASQPSLKPVLQSRKKSILWEHFQTSRKHNKRLYYQIYPPMSTVEGTIPLFDLLQMIETLAEKISNWLDSPISPQSKRGMDNFRLSMVRIKRTSCSGARAHAAHDRDDIKAALLPNTEVETWPPINSLSQRPPGRGKRYVYIWHCCACGETGIGIMTESCPGCGDPRCAYCRTEKVRVQ